MERAANDDGRYVLGCQNGDQKRKAKLLAIPLDRWKQITIAKAGRLGEGAMQAKGKYAAEAQKLFPYIIQGLSSLPRRGSRDMNKQRMSAWFDYMSQYRSTQFS